MLRIIFVSTVLFSLLAFFIPAPFTPFHRFTVYNPANLQFLGTFTADGSYLELPHNKMAFNLFTDKKNNETLLLRPQAPPLKINTTTYVTAPFLGNGYFTYRKLGKHLTYYDKKGEKLWQREHPYYPISDHYGNLILLLASDNSRVDIMDHNGLPLGEKQLYGILLIDYSFASQLSQVGLVFASGEAYVIQEEGKIAFQHNFASKYNMIFLKSCALSPNGKLLAVHLLKDEKDLIVILMVDEEQNPAILRQITLPKIYAHILHIAVNTHGVLVAAPDRTLFFSLSDDTAVTDHKANWSKKKHHSMYGKL